LSQVLRHLPKGESDNLLVGLETSDDAAVYYLNPDTALVQTVDFFTPIVDDPYLFGQIAAANSLSDIYAMGGKPLTALNIVAFPNCSLPMEVLQEILRGGAEKIAEAGAIIVGGHTIQDDEPKYGLSVLGTVHPQKVITNAAAEAGDYLVLTKPLGTGIIATALKGELASQEAAEAAGRTMASLNKEAGEAMQKVGAHACTDITGFGFLGHASEMAQGSEVTLEIEVDKLPLLPGVREYASFGLVPAGAYENREYLKEKVEFASSIEEVDRDILFDPQTSGGLLISLSPEACQEFLQLFPQGVVVGRVLTKGGHKVKVK